MLGAVALVGSAATGPRHVAEAASAPAPSATAPSRPPGDAAAIATGRTLFTRYCANCHTLDPKTAGSPIDLRGLRRRYGDATAAVFQITVAEGRPAVGMPPFKGILSQQTIARILAYLESIQSGSTP